MELHSLQISACLIILVFLISFSASSSTTRSFDYRIYRHRRSYESRHKGRENVPNGAVKVSTSGKSNVFATENCTVVVAQIGGTATLPCVVRKFNTGVNFRMDPIFGNPGIHDIPLALQSQGLMQCSKYTETLMREPTKVSWIRKHDYHLLTVGLTTYNADDRFMVEHVRHLQNWGLLIKHVQPSDAGLYECQVSTHPPTSIFIELKVTEASAEILGAPDLHLRAGSLLRLVCTLRQSTEPPSYVFWYHEQKMINYDPGVQVKADHASSVLLVTDADKSHNGNYTCSPSNAVPASINVHVLNATAEEKPAAMQHANTSSRSSNLFTNYSMILFLIMSVFQST